MCTPALRSRGRGFRVLLRAMLLGIVPLETCSSMLLGRCSWTWPRRGTLRPSAPRVLLIVKSMRSLLTRLPAISAANTHDRLSASPSQPTVASDSDPSQLPNLRIPKNRSAINLPSSSNALRADIPLPKTRRSIDAGTGTDAFDNLARSVIYISSYLRMQRKQGYSRDLIREMALVTRRREHANIVEKVASCRCLLQIVHVTCVAWHWAQPSGQSCLETLDDSQDHMTKAPACTAIVTSISSASCLTVDRWLTVTCIQISHPHGRT